MSFKLKKKEKENPKEVEKRKKEIISKCNITIDKEIELIQIRSKRFILMSQNRLEFDVETGLEVRTGTRYVLLRTINRKLIFKPEELEALGKTLDGINTNPFLIQLYDNTFRLKILGIRVKTMNFQVSELEGLQAMVSKFSELYSDLISEE